MRDKSAFNMQSSRPTTVTGTEYIRAFTAQAYKAAVEAGHSNGAWDLSWPLLGLPDPEEGQRSIASPAERVALAALAKERKLLKEVGRQKPPEESSSAPRQKRGVGGTPAKEDA